MNLQIVEDDAKALFKESAKGFAKPLYKEFKNWDDLPKNAKKAAFDMMYNMGENNFNRAKWPKFYSAYDMQDWKKAAEESKRYPEHKERNEKTKSLLESLLATE